MADTILDKRKQPSAYEHFNAWSPVSQRMERDVPQHVLMAIGKSARFADGHGTLRAPNGF